MLKGGWWWKSCGRGLNGLYMDDPNDLTARQGIIGLVLILEIFLFILEILRELQIVLSIFRHCVVPMERMGLYIKTRKNDDQTKELYI